MGTKLRPLLSKLSQVCNLYLSLSLTHSLIHITHCPIRTVYLYGQSWYTLASMASVLPFTTHCSCSLKIMAHTPIYSPNSALYLKNY